MTNFHGFCSYPHGGWVMFGVTISCIAALAATMWGVSSCRFAYLDFTSDRGDFSEFYLDPTPDGPPIAYRVGVGLFTWLKPFSPNDDWSSGQCTGYTEIQLEVFADNVFEVARIFSVLAVLGGMGTNGAVLFLSCISLIKFQIWALTAILAFLSIFTFLTFLFMKSTLCQDLVADQNEDYASECTLDQGGLVVIAAGILWAVACLLTIIYIKPPELDVRISDDGRITNAFEQRKLERAKMLQERQQKRAAAEKQRRAQQQQRKNQSSAQQSRSVASVMCEDEGATEVQLSPLKSRASQSATSPRSMGSPQSTGSSLAEI